jgi:ribonuclease P protein component
LLIYPGRESGAVKGYMHLTKSHDYAAVHQQGKWLSGRLIGIKSRPNGLAETRWGVITGKRVGNAVTRNRVKRRLREIMHRMPLKAGNDIVVIARSEVAQAEFKELGEKTLMLLARAGLLEENEIPGSKND